MVDGGEDEDLVRVVKMKLGTFCQDATREKLLARICTLVDTANQAVAEAYLFANFHLIRVLDDPKFEVAHLPHLDRNFYYRCLHAVSVSNVRNGTLSPELLASQAAFEAMRPPGYVKADITPYNQVIADLSIQMATMAQNSVWGNIEKFVYRYLRLKFPELKKLWKKIVLASVLNPKSSLSKAFGPSSSPSVVRAIEVATHLRAMLPLPTGGQFGSRAHLAMRLFHSILGELNAASAAPTTEDEKTTRKVRLFNLLPRKSGFTVSSIPISSMALMQLLSMGKTPLEVIKGDGRGEDHGRLWRKYFDVKGSETRTARFGNRIITDGYSVSVLRKVACNSADGEPRELSKFPKSCEAAECRCVDSDTVKVGVDPGMTDVVTTASSNGTTRSVSSAHFGEMAGYNTSRRRTDKWNRETEEQAKLIPSSKVASLSDIEAHIRGYLEVLPKLLMHRATRGYRAMRFMRYVRKQKAIETVCDVVAPRDKFVVVGFGNWNNNGQGIKRHCSGPVAEIRRALKRRRNVLYTNIDERNTSCKCHGCHERLVNMKADSVVCRKSQDGGRDKMVRLDTRVHKVLHCRNSVGSAPIEGRCGTTWNRDVNAAKNMLLLLAKWIRGEQRPAAFSWAPKPKRNTDLSRQPRRCTMPCPSDKAGQAKLLSGRPASNSHSAIEVEI